jgi:poly(3-hydroxybutyrate) depolymerase
MYEAYQAHTDLMWPLRTLAKTSLPWLRDNSFGWAELDSQRQLAALFELIKLGEITHHRPPFGIETVPFRGEAVQVVEEDAHVTPFGTLLHFRKLLPEDAPAQPRVLVVAPMSGHFATLLRDTVETMLPDHDVYITDWHNARDVPLLHGRFGLDEYTEHLMQFLQVIGPGAHLMAICQPCVAALSAVALMSEDGDVATPASLTLMAGPIDCRISPTEVNKLAMTKGIDWFEQNLVSRVPWRFKGGGRRVYPGFMQLTAFMSMNKERHLEAFREYYNNLAAPDEEKLQKAEHTRKFYEEYFAVADLPAEFYLETVSLVFQEYALPQGQLKFRGRSINPAAIRRTALLTVEGERDDICSTGQTLAAQDLCTNLRPYMRTHYVQAGVGHYGVFSGRRWRQQIYPVVRDVIHVSQ